MSPFQRLERTAGSQAVSTLAVYDCMLFFKDLLDLMDAALPEGRDFRLRFPNLRILTPGDFVQEIAK